MEELRRISKYYFDHAPRTTLESLRVLFDDAYHYMCPEDGLVSFPRFYDYMTEVGRPDLANRAFFDNLDSNGDGKLDHEDVATLAYIVFSQRHTCRGCVCFIDRENYYTCATCVQNNEHPYVLCLDCHENIRDFVDHEHEDFVFNFPLSESPDREKLTRETSNQSVPRSQASSSDEVDEVMPTQKSSSTGVVTGPRAHTRPQQFHWRDGLTIAGIGVSTTSVILSQCSIL